MEIWHLLLAPFYHKWLRIVIHKIIIRLLWLTVELFFNLVWLSFITKPVQQCPVFFIHLITLVHFFYLRMSHNLYIIYVPILLYMWTYIDYEWWPKSGCSGLNYIIIISRSLYNFIWYVVMNCAPSLTLLLNNI